MNLGPIFYLPDEKNPRIVVHEVEAGYDFRFQVDPDKNNMILSSQVVHDKTSTTNKLHREQKKALESLRTLLNEHSPGSVK